MTIRQLECSRPDLLELVAGRNDAGIDDETRLLIAAAIRQPLVTVELLLEREGAEKTSFDGWADEHIVVIHQNADNGTLRFGAIATVASMLGQIVGIGPRLASGDQRVLVERSEVKDAMANRRVIEGFGSCAAVWTLRVDAPPRDTTRSSFLDNGPEGHLWQIRPTDTGDQLMAANVGTLEVWKAWSEIINLARQSPLRNSTIT